MLTRATQTDIPAANPALLPFGAKNFRWMGIRTSLYPGSSSVDLARQLTQNQNALEKKTTQDFIDIVFDHPLFLFSQPNNLAINSAI